MSSWRAEQPMTHAYRPFSRARELALDPRRLGLTRGAFVAKVFASVLALGLTNASTASAQTRDELDKARALFQEGVALAAANNCAAALTKYRAVAKVKMTPQ